MWARGSGIILKPGGNHYACAPWLLQHPCPACACEVLDAAILYRKRQHTGRPISNGKVAKALEELKEIGFLNNFDFDRDLVRQQPIVRRPRFAVLSPRYKKRDHYPRAA